MKLDRCCGIVVLKNNKVLLGKRSDGQGWGLAGGKLEEGEDFYSAALRELHEEFNIHAVVLLELGRVEAHARVKGVETLVAPLIYLCRAYEGEPKADGKELSALQWFTYEAAISELSMFPPSKAALLAFKEAILL